MKGKFLERRKRTTIAYTVYICGEFDFSMEECRLASCQFSEIIAPEDRANLGLGQT